MAMSEEITGIAEEDVLPNFEGVLNFGDIQSRFIKAARWILSTCDLVHGENRWQITALELYLYTDKWRDPTTHGLDEQLNSGTWYVHDNGTRAPNYSGIDITCGSRRVGIHAGLLVRELARSDGSARAFHTIVRGNYSFRRRDTWSPEEKIKIGAIHQTGVFSGPLRLERCPSRQGSLWIGPRKLPRKVPDEFRNACLRVATWRTKLHRSKMKEIAT
jgi:hypothetical protein